MAGKTYIKTGSATWERIKKIYLKEGATTWRAIRKGYIKISSTVWAKIYDTASNRPYLANSDRPRIRLNSYRTTGYIEAEPVQQFGPPITNPTSGWPTGTVGDFLWGANANDLNNWKSGNGSALSSTYQWLYSPGTDPNGQVPITVNTESTGQAINKDKFENIQTYLGQYDNKYIWFKVNYTNSAGVTSAVSNPVLIVKQLPVRNSSGVTTPSTGAPIDTAWSYTFDIQDYWYNSIDKAASRVEWFLTTSNTSPVLDSTTRVKTDYINNIYTQGTNIITGTSSYTPTTAGGAIGKYVYIRLVLVNSNTLYQYPSTGYIAHEMSRGPITGPAAVDIYPTLIKLDGYLTIPASGLYTGETTDGTAYTQCRLRGNTGSYTPNPTNVYWDYRYSSTFSGIYNLYYDSGGNFSGAVTYDTLENQNHDYYLEDNFYTTSAGFIPNDTTNRVASVGKYIKFTATANPSGTPTTNSITLGPIYDYTTAPGAPTISWTSAYDANNSYVSAYWSAATKVGTYFLQYYNGTSWVSLGSGTTSTPTVNSPAGPYLVPHGSRLFRVINQNAEGVYAKSSSISFDSTPPPGNVTDIRNFNWTTWNSQLFLTTGIRTTSVSYTFNSTNLSNFSIGPFTRSTSSSYPYLFTDNLSGYFTSRTWNVDTYNSSTTYFYNNTVWYAGNQYTANYIGSNTGFSGQVPTNTTYWTKTTTVTYNIADYVLYNNTYYFCRTATNGTYPTNTTYWSSLAGFVVTATPYNGTKAGTALTAGMTLLLRPDANTDPAPNITTGPTFSSITQTSFVTNYNPNTYSTYAVIDVKTGSPLTSINGYPKSVTTTTNTNNTDSVTGRTQNTLHYVYITPRYMYNNTYNVYYDGSQTNSPVTTLATAPNAFSYSISQAGSVTTPPTPSMTRVSSTSNTLVFEMTPSSPYSTLPADTFRYGLNQSGAAITNGFPAQYPTLNQWDASGNYNGTGPYDTITSILSSANNSAATIWTTAYGTTRQANINVSTTTGALSWAINFSWSGASTSGVTYYSNGTGFTSSSTASTVTVYTNSMPAVLATITGANDPTITINSVTAYSGSNQTGSTTAGSGGSPTSASIGRPTATSGSVTNYYTYYTAPSYTSPTPSSVTYNSSTQQFSVNFSGGSGPWYQVWYQTSSGLFGTVDSAPDAAGTSSPVVKTLAGVAGTTYYWWVRSASSSTATGSANVSAWSGPVSVTIASTPKPPNDPTGLTTPSSGTSPNLIFNSSSWTAPAVDATHNAATYYQVYFEAGTSSTGPWNAASNTFTYKYSPATGTATATNANTQASAVNVYATSVSSGTVTASTGSYTWVNMWVRAANADGYSNWVSKSG